MHLNAKINTTMKRVGNYANQFNMTFKIQSVVAAKRVMSHSYYKESHEESLTVVSSMSGLSSGLTNVGFANEMQQHRTIVMT